MPAPSVSDTVVQGETAAASSLTISATVSNVADRLMVARINIFDDPATTISSVTYGGTGLTSIGSQQAAPADGKDFVAMYRLIAPAVGTANLVITPASTCEIIGAVTTYKDVNQTTPTGTPAGAAADAGGTSETATVDVSSAVGELVIDACGGWDSNAGWTQAAGAGQTGEFANNNGSAMDSLAGSYEAGASTVTMSWSRTGLSSGTGGGYWILGVSLKPVGVAAGNPWYAYMYQ